jgi:hypothetical protein
LDVIGPEIVIPAGWITQKDRVTGSSASGAENRPSIKGKKVFTAGTRQKKALVRAPICIYLYCRLFAKNPRNLHVRLSYLNRALLPIVLYQEMPINAAQFLE